MKFFLLTDILDQFYIESIVGLNSSGGQGGAVGDGSSSPTSKKEEVAMSRGGNISTMSKSLNEHMYLVVRR